MPFQHRRFPPPSASSTSTSSASDPRSCPSSSSVASCVDCNDVASASTTAKEERDLSRDSVFKIENDSTDESDKATSYSPSVYCSDGSVKKKKIPNAPKRKKKKRSKSEPVAADPVDRAVSFQFPYSWADKFESTSPYLATALQKQKESQARKGKIKDIDFSRVEKPGEGSVSTDDDDDKQKEEFEFLFLSDYGFNTPPDLFSEAELDIISLNSDGSEKLIFELDSEEEKELYSTSSEDEANDGIGGAVAGNGSFDDGEEDCDELPRYENTRIIYDTAEFLRPSPVGALSKASARKKHKIVTFSDYSESCKFDAEKEEKFVDEPVSKIQDKVYANVPSAGQLGRFLVEVQKMMKRMTHKSVASLSMDGVEKRLRLIGVRDPSSVSSCVKKAILDGFLRVEGPHSLLQLICYQRCPGEKCKKIIRVRFLDVLRQGDFGSDPDQSDGDVSRCVVRCDSAECRLPVFVTNICIGEPTLVKPTNHHHCQDCPRWGTCLNDTELRHCHKCACHFHHDLREIVDLRHFPKMACDACQLSDAKVCEFVNGFLDDSPLDPFELRLVGPNQLNPCVLAAIKSQLVSFPQLSSSASARVKRKIEDRGGIVILDKNMNVDDFLLPISLAKQLLNCAIFEGVCFVCSAPLKMSWAEALYLDYDEMRPDDLGVAFPITCPRKNCGRRNYLIEACRGTPRFQGFEFVHSHCSFCPGFGWCHRQNPSHCPRCGRHSAGVKGELLCDTCRLESSEAEDFQLPEEEKFRILNAAKKRPTSCLFVEDDSISSEIEDACQVQ